MNKRLDAELIRQEIKSFHAGNILRRRIYCFGRGCSIMVASDDLGSSSTLIRIGVSRRLSVCARIDRGYNYGSNCRFVKRRDRSGKCPNTGIGRRGCLRMSSGFDFND